MQRIKKLTAIILSILTVSSVFVFGGTFSAGASGTGAGLAEWALNAYYSGWTYVYGGSSEGAVDCSGLIWTYCGGDRVNMLDTSTESGSISSIPNVHGLGLYQPGHVGVYVGNGYEVDARSDYDGICYEKLSDSYMGWTHWFKLAAVTYIENGWEEFNGDYYYYEDGEYITDTSREIDGTTYYFDSEGCSSQTPSDTSSKASSSSSSSSSSSDSGSSSSSSSSATLYLLGSSGSEVEKIQTRLQELGYYNGSINGEFDEATQSAYMSFQLDAGLTVDGISGSDREVLYSDDAPYASTQEASEETEVDESNGLTIGSKGDEVKKLQEKLAELGYYFGDADGEFGEATAEAVKSFQYLNGLWADGIVDEETSAMIFAAEAEATEEATEATDAAATVGPVQLTEDASASSLIITNEQNQSYADTASDVVTKTNKVAQKALSQSSSVTPVVTTAKVKRTANVWIWFVLVAIILGVISLVFFMRDRKSRRYERYLAKKKKREAKAELTARW